MSLTIAQTVTGVTMADVSTADALRKFKTAIIKSVANALNLYGVGGSVTDVTVTAAGSRRLARGRGLLQSGVTVNYNGTSCAVGCALSRALSRTLSRTLLFTLIFITVLFIACSRHLHCDGLPPHFQTNRHIPLTFPLLPSLALSTTLPTYNHPS